MGQYMEDDFGCQAKFSVSCNAVSRQKLIECLEQETDTEHELHQKEQTRLQLDIPQAITQQAAPAQSFH